MSRKYQDVVLAAAMCIFGLMAVLFWVPNDIDTGLIDKFRRQVFIGDAMLPSVAAIGLLFCSLVLLVQSLRIKTAASLEQGSIDKLSFVFFSLFGAIVASCLGVIFWGGPIALNLFSANLDDAATYRQLRDTAPWKYIGYLLGGFALTFVLTSLIEGTMSFKRAVSSLLAVVLLILIFDVPFDNLLLPPNGDW